MTQDHEHRQDIIVHADGTDELRDPKVVVDDEVLSGTHSGSVCIHSGAAFEISGHGHLSGSLRLQSGSSALILGQHSGSLHVATGSVVEILGNHSGSVHVARGGLVRVHQHGKLAGSLHVAGAVENRGTRGGSVHLNGTGSIQDLEGGSAKRPSRLGNSNTYIW